MLKMNDARELTFIELTNVLLRRRRAIVLTGTLVTAAAIGLALLTPPQFAAVSKFVPATSEPTDGRLGSLAAQFGLGGALGRGDQSPEFYVALLRSREILEEAVETIYTFVDKEGESKSGTYAQLARIDGEDRDDVLRNAVLHLLDHSSVSSSAATQMVTMEVRAEWEALAEQLTQRLLELASEFNLERRQSQARAERQFIERRLEEAEHSLLEAEDALQKFLSENRVYETSPQLRFDAARLQRRVDLQQQVFTTLTQSFEQARIDEVRNTPLITVIEVPQGSGRPVPVRRTIAAVGLVTALFAGIAVAACQQYLSRHEAEQSDEYEELRRLSADAWRGLKPWSRKS